MELINYNMHKSHIQVSMSILLGISVAWLVLLAEPFLSDTQQSFSIADYLFIVDGSQKLEPTVLLSLIYLFNQLRYDFYAHQRNSFNDFLQRRFCYCFGVLTQQVEKLIQCLILLLLSLLLDLTIGRLMMRKSHGQRSEFFLQLLLQRLSLLYFAKFDQGQLLALLTDGRSKSQHIHFFVLLIKDLFYQSLVFLLFAIQIEILMNCYIFEFPVLLTTVISDSIIASRFDSRMPSPSADILTDQRLSCHHSAICSVPCRFQSLLAGVFIISADTHSLERLVFFVTPFLSIDPSVLSCDAVATASQSYLRVSTICQINIIQFVEFVQNIVIFLFVVSRA